MKVRSTKKQLQESFSNIICVPASTLQHLLNYEEPTYYCADREGWMCDIYTFGDVAICTGYRSFGNITPPFEIIDDFESQSLAIIRNHNEIPEENKEGLVKKLIEDFIVKVLG